MANRIGGMVVPFLVFFLGAHQVSEQDTGWIVTALGAGGVAGSVLGGWLADRAGHRTTLLIGLLAAPASLGFLFAAPGVPVMAAAAVLVGVTAKIYPPAAAALVADGVTGAQRLRAFSLIHWAYNIGAAGAAALAGFLAAHGFGLIFAIDAGTSLLFAAIVVAGIPRTGRRTRPAGGTGYGILLRDKLMLAFVALALSQEIVYSLTEYAVPLSIRLDGLSPAVFGTVAVVNAALVVLLQPVVYPVVARLNRYAVLAGATAVVGLGIAATGLGHTPLWYAITTAIWSVGEVAGGIVAGAIAADLAPAGAQGRYQGVITWTAASARLIGPAVTTWLFSTAGPGALWSATAVTGVVGAVCLLALAPALARRSVPAPAPALVPA